MYSGILEKFANAAYSQLNLRNRTYQLTSPEVYDFRQAKRPKKVGNLYSPVVLFAFTVANKLHRSHNERSILICRLYNEHLSKLIDGCIIME